jgi:chaperonin GroEL (HSP60 family)
MEKFPNFNQAAAMTLVATIQQASEKAVEIIDDINKKLPQNPKGVTAKEAGRIVENSVKAFDPKLWDAIEHLLPR